MEIRNIKLHTWGKLQKNKKELETLYSKFSDPKLDKVTTITLWIKYKKSNAFN